MSCFVRLSEYDPDKDASAVLGEAIYLASSIGRAVTLEWRGVRLLVAGTSRIDELVSRINERRNAKMMESLVD